MPTIQTLYDAILNGNAKAAKEITQTSLAAGTNPQALVDDTMIPAMNEVGRRYEANEYFVPELLIAARAMKASLELIRPLLSARGAEPVGRVVIGTVQGTCTTSEKTWSAPCSREPDSKSSTWASTFPPRNS